MDKFTEAFNLLEELKQFYRSEGFDISADRIESAQDYMLDAETESAGSRI